MSLFLPYGTAKAGNGGRGSEADGLPPKFFVSKAFSPLIWIVPLLCVFLVELFKRGKKMFGFYNSPPPKRKAWTFRPLLYYNKTITD